MEFAVNSVNGFAVGSCKEVIYCPQKAGLKSLHCVHKMSILQRRYNMTTTSFFQRFSLLVGEDAAKLIEHSRVIVFGLGGVGSWCAEALVRSGVTNITLVDSDTVCPSNVNRQLQATSKNLKRLKTDSLAERLKDINPSCNITLFPSVFSEETAASFDIPGADYVVDAIDSLAHKLHLIEVSLDANVRFFSSMGMAQKLDPTLIKTADIWKTYGCPLARLVRQGLRKRKISRRFTAVYSPERIQRIPPQPAPPPDELSDSACAASETRGMWDSGKKVINGTTVTVTAAAGMVLASLVIKDAYERAQGASVL